jgi:hypothetical protein
MLNPSQHRTAMQSQLRLLYQLVEWLDQIHQTSQFQWLVMLLLSPLIQNHQNPSYQ